MECDSSPCSQRTRGRGGESQREVEQGVGCRWVRGKSEPGLFLERRETQDPHAASNVDEAHLKCPSLSHIAHLDVQPRVLKPQPWHVRAVGRTLYVRRSNCRRLDLKDNLVQRIGLGRRVALPVRCRRRDE